MQTIRAGDLYFLTSPIHADDCDTAKEKRLSYLLGIPSARPAIVIHPPAWWDPFNMVTVITALTRGSPAINLRLKDRYDRETRADYPFIPHHVTSVPVSRLGKYIGSLDDDELREVLYAFHWINDPFMQKDTQYKVPNAYRDVFRNKMPKGSWTAQRDTVANAVIHIGRDNNFRSDTNPEINGLPAPNDRHFAVHPKLEKAIRQESIFIPVETPLPDAVEATPDEVTVPVEKSFPPSMFSTEVLNAVAGRFDIDGAYYLNVQKRDPYVIDVDEDGIRHGLTDREVQDIMECYVKMSTMDAYLLGPRLPTYVLAEITGFNSPMATVLKLLCNHLRDMTDVEYAEKLAAKNPVKPEEPEPEAEPVDYKPMLQKIKPYLSAQKIAKIPDDLQGAFIQIPKGIIKRAWTGTQFEASYKKALAQYKKG